jgi:hypothetical protein
MQTQENVSDARVAAPQLPASRFQAAAQRARSVASDDSIPPARRRFVRDYFRAIAPGGQR